MFWLKNRTVLMCANANPRIGTRLVRRCIALADHLSQFGFQTHWVTPQLPVSLRKKIASQRAGHSIANVADSDFDLSDYVDELSPAWTVMAGSHENTLEAVESKRNLRLSDGSDWRSSVVSVGGEVQVFDEPKYSIACEPENDDLELKSRVRRIAWIYDSDTDCDIKAAVIKFIQNNAKKSFSVDLLATENQSDAQDLAGEIQDAGHSVRVHSSADRLESLLMFADVAIASNSHWVAELSLQNLPVLFLAGQENDDPLVDGLYKRGAIEWVQKSTEPRGIQKQIARFFNNVELRRERCQESFKLYDELGAERIARAMAAGMFHFRRCEMADGDRLLDWRNDPELRVVCFDSRRIERDEHFDWLSNQIDSDHSEIFIIENENGQSVGQFRLEYDDRFETAQLNLGVIPSLRGMGIGTGLLERVCRDAMARRRDLEVYANIRTTNVISQTALRKAGFKPVSTMMIRGQVSIRFSMQRFDARAAEVNYQYKKAS